MMRSCVSRLSLALIVALTALPRSTAAQTPAVRPQIAATRVQVPPRIDGVLDDPAWLDAPVQSDFIQQLPNEGARATERTEVRIVYDQDHVYIGARCYDSEPQRIIANEMKRDVSSISTKDDSFAVVFDPFHDFRNGPMFIVTPKGSMHDLFVTDERQFNWDWSTVWDARTTIDEHGWTVEMVVPFRSLRYDLALAPVWGIAVRRSVLRKGEHTFLLSRLPRELGVQAAGRLSAAVDLTGLADITRGRNLEFKPFVTSGSSQDNSAAPAGAERFVEGGLDLKYGITQGLNLDVTYNTDFAQVEADTQQLNLTRFSLFFPEKRDFFLEGRDIYTFGVPQGVATRNPNTTLLFFSRRIGLERGREIPMHGGARLTGRAGPYSIGVLNITTGSLDLVPTTNFTVARVKRNIFQRSNVGAMFTARNPRDGDAQRAFGVDANFFFGRSTRASAFLASSQAPGVPSGDVSGRAQFTHEGDTWGLDVDHLSVGPNFNPSVGFVRRRDIRSNYGRLRYSPRFQRKRVRQAFFTADFDYITGFDHGLQSRATTFGSSIDSHRSDALSVTVTRSFERLTAPFGIQQDVTIPEGTYRFTDAAVRLTSGPSRKIAGFVDYAFGSFFAGRRRSLTFNSISKPTSHLAYSLNYQINDVRLPYGAFRNHLVGTRLDYAATTRLFTAAFLQWNSDAELGGINFRLQYRYKPGSDLYIVYNENRHMGTADPSLMDRSFVVKMTYLLRL